MNEKKRIGRLYVITDTAVQSRFSHTELAELAIAGGADMIQFRDKRMPSGERVATAKAMARVCRRSGVPLIVNDRVDIALAAEADGVHLGEEDLPVDVARDLLGPGKIIGATAPTLEKALRAEADGADYIGFGHIYPTGSKKKPGPPQGVDPLREVVKRLRIPVIAIGGIDASNIGPVLEAGAWGVAVIGAVCAAEDPRQATAEIRKALPLKGRNLVRGIDTTERDDDRV